MTTAAFPLDHLTLLVSSFERVMPFYETLLPMLGMRRKRAHVWTNDAWLFFQFGEAKPETRAYERYGAGLNHAGFAAPDLATVEHIRETMLAAGHFASEVQSFGEHKAVFFRDPDGLRIEVGYMPPGVDPVD